MNRRQFLFTALLLVPRIMPETQNSSPQAFRHQGWRGVVEDNFSTDQGTGWGWGHGFCMIQKYYIDCALYFYCYYITCTLNHQALDPGGWTPLT